MVDNNDALFRELQEEVRREQYAKIWQRYGNYIIGVAAAIIVGVAGHQIWQSRQQALQEAAGAQFEAASTLSASAKTEDAAKAFADLAANGPAGYAALSALSEAGAYLKLDKPAEALVIFDRLANSGSTDPLLSNYARLQAAALRLGEADFTEMENRLKPLIGDGSSWRFVARELLGTAAVKAGKLDEARTTLTPLLADPGLSRSAAERINRLMATIASAELSTKPAENTTPATDADKPAPTPAPAP